MKCLHELLSNEAAFAALCDLKETMMNFDNLDEFYTAFSEKVQPNFLAKDSNRWLIFALFFILHTDKSNAIINEKTSLMTPAEQKNIIKIIEATVNGRTKMPTPNTIDSVKKRQRLKRDYNKQYQQWVDNQEKHI